MSSADYGFDNDAEQHVAVRGWLPPGPCRGVVVISHGMAEHAGRYARFADVLTKNGFAVYAPDHRGHGATAAGRLGYGGPDAWNGTVRDLKTVVDRAKAAHPGVPLFLFGHSMGSFVAQRFAQLHGAELRGLILSGTSSGLDNAEAVVAAAVAQADGPGADRPSPLVGAIFASYNAAFEPVATPFDWLSRDAAEVRAYIEDPLCGFPFTSGLLADHLRGWVETWKPENERGIPAGLPILSFAGSLDPVGAASGAVEALTQRYRSYGIEHIETVLYPEARHETLNETNRDDVQADVLTWLTALS